MQVRFLKPIKLAVGGIDTRSFNAGDVAKLPDAQALEHIAQGNVAAYDPREEVKPAQPVEEAKAEPVAVEKKPKRSRKKKADK